MYQRRGPPEASRAAGTATATNANTEALALKRLGDPLKTLAKTGDASSKDASKESKESKESTEQKEHQNQLRLVTIAATFRKRSVELHSDKGKHFVVLSRRAYGKLAVMFRATCVLLKDEKSLLPLGEVDAKFLTEFALRKKQKKESEKPEKPVSKVQKLVDSEDEDEGDAGRTIEKLVHGKRRICDGVRQVLVVYTDSSVPPEIPGVDRFVSLFPAYTQPLRNQG